MRLPGPVYLVQAVVIFGTAAAALYATDHPSLAGALVLIAVINRILMVLWDQYALDTPVLSRRKQGWRWCPRRPPHACACAHQHQS